jgi:hypothetical protein
MFVPLFRDCRLVELAIVAALAKIGEEMLFRGVIQSVAAAEIGGQRGVRLALLLASGTTPSGAASRRCPSSPAQPLCRRP